MIQRPTSIKVRYNHHNEYKFDVFFLAGLEWVLYKTCDHREDYISKLGFEDPKLNEYIKMRVEEMFL